MRRVRGLTVGLCALALAAAAAPAVAEEVNLDPTFSGDGKVYVQTIPSTVLSLARDAGDVYTAGQQPTVGADSQIPFVGRLDDDGVPDASFSGDGIRSLPTIGGRFWITDLTVDGPGRAILVAQSQSRTIVARFTITGELDDTFSGDGLRQFDGGATPIYLFPVVDIDSHGRIVVAAMVERSRSGHSDVVVRRLLRNGSLDSTWSGDGVKVVDNAEADWVEGLAIDGQDRVLLGSDTGGSSPALIYRFKTNGQVDRTFSDDGVASFRFEPRRNAFGLGIGINGAGNITVAGSSCCSSKQTTFGIARFLPNGHRDVSYGDRGILALSCTNCFPTWADVDGGQVAIIIDPYQGAGLTRLVRVSASGTYLRHESVDIYPRVKSELVIPVEIDGTRVLLGGDSKGGAFVARIA